MFRKNIQNIENVKAIGVPDKKSYSIHWKCKARCQISSAMAEGQEFYLQVKLIIILSWFQLNLGWTYWEHWGRGSLRENWTHLHWERGPGWRWQSTEVSPTSTSLLLGTTHSNLCIFRKFTIFFSFSKTHLFP